jgi:hypothetical protein
MLPKDSHELPLPPAEKPQTELWSENFAFALSDVKAGISFLHSIGTWYGDTAVWREKLTVQMPDGRILIGRNYGRRTAGNAVSASLSRYEILEHERCVRLTWDGPIFSHSFDELLTRGFYGGLAKLIRLDVTFEANAPIWMMSKGDSDATGVTGALHTEQLGYCAGTLAYEGQNYRIAGALGCRDHSRGKRDFASYKEHCWINGEFPGKRGFQLYAANIFGHDEPALSTAVVIEGGTLHPAAIKHVEFIGSASDHHKPQTIVLDSDLGEMVIRATHSRTCLPVSVLKPFEAQAGVMRGQEHGLIFDETIDLEWDGHKGLGWSERGFAKNPG